LGIILKTKKHYLTRFPLWLSGIIFLALSPFIIGYIGAYFSELITNEPCHEGSCFWAVIPWLGIFVTLPIGAIVILIFLIIIIIDSFKLIKSKK
jgi:hypothetical protein